MSEPPPGPIFPALDMRGVGFSAMRDPATVVAEDVNWKVAPGEFWVVAGPQRAGKSDLLMLAGGLMAPTRGAYWFFGEAMPVFEDARLAERLRLGLVFDNGQLFNHLTLAGNVALPLRYHRNLSPADTLARVQSLLELTELVLWADSLPASVGRGLHKRAGLARALALQPDVLLLDNPLGGLNVRQTVWWLELLDALSQGRTALGGRPMTLVVTADDLRPWRSNARRFALLRDRRFTVLGGWADVEGAADPAVRDLLGGH